MRPSFASLPVILFAIIAALAAQPVRPEPPSNIWAAQTGARDITLVWTRVPGAVQYRLFEGTGDDAKPVGRTSSSGDQFVRIVKTFGVEHRYSIDAVFENGEVSPRVAFNPVVPREATAGPVAAPTKVTAASGSKGISLAWDAVAGASAYRIARRISAGGFQILCRLCPTDTTYLDASATPGATHEYMVTAVGPSGASRPVRSNEVTANAAQDTAAPPNAARTARADETPPRGTITVPPVPGGCLSVGSEGNVAVRLADGSVQFFERVHFERGMRLVPDPAFRPVPGIANAVAVRTSGEHTLILLADGTMRAFGMNDHGQLGAAPGYYSGVPVAVRDITNAVGVAAGANHSVAVLADGSIRIWGEGDRGIPGDGRTDVTSNRTRVAIVAGITNAKVVAAGAFTTFALLADGTVRGWGGNFGGLGFYGVLGSGETGISSATPQPVLGVANAIDITTSGAGSLALLADRRVMAWGSTRLPMRTAAEDYLMTKRALPVPGIRNAVAVSPYLILLADGTVRDIFRPEVPVAGVQNAVAITSNPTNRYALLADGRLLGWGLKQFWPKGVVTVAQYDPATARECSVQK